MKSQNHRMRTRSAAVPFAAMLALVASPQSPAQARPNGSGAERATAATHTPYPAAVSANRRFLIDQFGKPFFYLGDTAWELFHRLSRQEAETYLRDRAAQRFNVIQAVVLAELGGLVEPNPQGNLPLENNDPTRPLEPYFQDVDWVVDRAEALGLAIGMLPTWGDKWNKKWGLGPEIFTPENARTYGRFLGARYRDKPIVWILGGDRPVENQRHREIIRAMAEGLREGDGGRHLISFHPTGQQSSADFFHAEDWLDFNMCQTGHGFDHPNYNRIATDYARQPPKPCLDAEPGYEDHPAEFKASNGYLDDSDVRKFAYWAVFAGACGHTYGCHDIWQFYSPQRKPISEARTPWPEALLLPGSRQMKHLRALIESRPMLDRIPDPQLIAGDPATGGEHIQATRAADGAYAMIYTPLGRPIAIQSDRLSGNHLRAWWFNPRTGEATRIGDFPREETRTFSPPSQGKGHDWVLVLDATDRPFPTPGSIP